MTLVALKSIPFDSRTVRYTVPPHLKDGGDWHVAHIKLIESALSQLRSGHNIIEVPGYPASYDPEIGRFDELLETASYWEGAIYYLCKVLEFKTALEGLLTLECTPYRDMTSKNRLFYAIWNSHQQLPLLKAFLIFTKKDHHPNSKWIVVTKYKNWDAKELLDWSATFTQQNPPEMFPYSNPLYCGTNGLHLGGIKGGVLV